MKHSDLLDKAKAKDFVDVLEFGTSHSKRKQIESSSQDKPVTYL